MKQVTGWLTDEGDFFEQKEQAALAEAESMLEANYRTMFPNGNFDRFKEVISNLGPSIRGYQNAAYQFDQANGGRASRTTEFRVPVETDAEEEIAALAREAALQGRRGPRRVPIRAGTPRASETDFSDADDLG